MKALDVLGYVRHVLLLGIIIVTLLFVASGSSYLAQYQLKIQDAFFDMLWVVGISFLLVFGYGLFIAPYKIVDNLGGLDEGLNLLISQSPRIPEKSWWAGIEVSPKGSSPVDVYAKVEEIYFTHHGEIGKDYDTWFLKSGLRLPFASGRMSNDGIIHINRGDSEYLQIVQNTTIRGIAIVPHPLPKALPQVYELISSLMPYYIVVSIYHGNNLPDTKIFKIENCSMGKCEVSFVDKIAAEQSVQRTGGESGQQSLFSAGEVLPAKVTRQSTRR